MDELPVAELLPGLYREVLDAVAVLERLGHRQAAARVRSDATAAYSKAWNDRAADRLRRLRNDARRMAGPHGRPRRDRAWETGQPATIERRPA